MSAKQTGRTENTEAVKFINRSIMLVVGSLLLFNVCMGWQRQPQDLAMFIFSDFLVVYAILSFVEDWALARRARKKKRKKRPCDIA
jgi:cytochrome c oxidase assembly factor CtaG